MKIINIKNKSGATAIFMTMVILSAILVVSLSASDMVLKGMKYNRTRYDSAKAFYAAETGAEQIMWEIRKDALNPINDCNNDNDIFCFNNTTSVIEECVAPISCTGTNLDEWEMTNNSIYDIEFYIDHHTDTSLSSTTLLSTGTFKDEVRKIKLTYRSGE